jgi:hypothetical protein
VFSEIFLVQIHQNFGKYIPKFVFKAKIISENAFRSLKLGVKMEIRGGKKSYGGWDEKISSINTLIISNINMSMKTTFK